MDRRPAGIVVLVVVMVAVAIVPSIAGRRIAGSPIAAVFADPPQVGDCLVSEFQDAGIELGSPPEMPVTAARFGTCEGAVGGEIVAVWANAEDAATAPSSRLGGPCYRPAAEFAGLESSRRSTDLPGAPSGGPVRWKPTIGFDPYHVVPGRLERNAGRSWVACLAVPTGHTRYRGTLLDAFTTGLMPPEFGLCWATADLDQMPGLLRCDQPHPTELLATGWIRDRVEAPTTVIEQSCTDIAGRIMRTADPTRGGELRIVADRLTAGVRSSPDAPLTIACFVTSAGPQQLSGTLVGLADRPVPLVE